MATMNTIHNQVEILVSKGVVGYATRINGELKVGTYPETVQTADTKAAIYTGIARVLTDMLKSAKPGFYQVSVQDAVALRLIGLKKRFEELGSVDDVISYHAKSMFSDAEKSAFKAVVTVWAAATAKGFTLAFKNARTLFNYQILPQNKGEDLKVGETASFDHSVGTDNNGKITDITVATGTFKVTKREFVKHDGTKSANYYAVRTTKLADGQTYDAASLCKMIAADPQKVIDLAQSDSAVRWIYGLVNHTELVKIMPRLKLETNFNKVSVSNGKAF